MKQIILQIAVMAAIICYNEAKSDFNEEMASTGKYFRLERNYLDTGVRMLRPRRQTLGNSKFDDTYGEGARQNNGRSGPSSQNRKPTSQPPTTSATSSSTTADPRIAQCIKNCRFVNFADYVCASDGVTYMNEPHFNCAVKCGRNITIQYRAVCA